MLRHVPTNTAVLSAGGFGSVRGMRFAARNAPLGLLLIAVLVTTTGQAQSSSGDAQAGDSDKAIKLRQQIEDTRKHLADLEGQLAAEQQRKRQEEAAAEVRKRQQQLAAEEKTQLPAPGVLPATSAGAPHHSIERTFALNIVSDQKAIWTSPLHIRLNDIPTLFPFFAVTAVTMASDTSIEKRLPHSPTLIRRSSTLSNYGLASLLGGAGALYLWGKKAKDDHAQETGFLAGEAVVDSLLDAEAIKFVTGRERPLQGNGRGGFWQGGNSFPSVHAAAAWSAASIIAHEYPGPLTQLLAYGAASGVSAARIISRQHFTSDVLVGGALGWYTGWQVYRAHHSPELNGAEWGTFERSHEPMKARDMGSPYVPLDSWVYPVFDRLQAMGYAPSGFATRPWTRMECARLVEEAGTLLQESDSRNGEAVRLYHALATEFSREVALSEGGRNLGAEVDSIYSRSTVISGPPLTDGYHFGQTIYNDFGRPYAEGFNQISGISARSEAGPLAFYFRGEYQHAPAAAAVPLSVQAAIATTDGNSLVPAASPTAINHLQLLDSYASLNIKGIQISAGRQSLWYGPGLSGPLIWSDNAVPMPMVRISQNSPVKLPGIHWPVRTEFFLGMLEGHHFPTGGYIHGQRISFKPASNLEVGFARTVMFAGAPQPLTWGTFYHSFFKPNSGTLDPRLKPGDQRNSFDFSYRLPGIRKWVMLTGNAVQEEYPSPWAAPRRAPWNPGIYMPQIPKLPKLDLRIEGTYTNVPSAHNVGLGRFIYWELFYRDGYTNQGNLLGNWIGREGTGFQAWSTYWLSPRSTVQVNFRRATVSRDFLEGGEYTDFGARADLLLRPQLSLYGSVQYEQWDFPLLSPVRNSNFTTSIQLTYWPKWRTR